MWEQEGTAELAPAQAPGRQPSRRPGEHANEMVITARKATGKATHTFASTHSRRAESLSLPTPVGLPDELVTISQGGYVQTARGGGQGRGRRAHEGGPQAWMRTGSFTPVPAAAGCGTGERERDLWLCGVEYPKSSTGLLARRGGTAQPPPVGATEPGRRQQQGPVDRERLAEPAPEACSSRPKGPRDPEKPNGMAAAGPAGTAVEGSTSIGRAAGLGAAAAKGRELAPGMTVPAAIASDWAKTAAAMTRKASGSPRCQPSLVAISLQAEKKVQACKAGPEATGWGPAPSTCRDTSVSCASAKAATATASRVADSSAWATKAECSESARLNSFCAWDCRVTAVWRRSECVRPDSMVIFAALTAALASARPFTAKGRSGCSLSIRSQESTRDLAAFRAESAGDRTLGSNRGAGGAAGAAAAFAERTATWAGERCEGVAGWEASGLPKPLVAQHRLQVLWNAQLVLNPQLQAQTGSLDFAGRPTASGPGGGAAARRGAMTEQQEDESERNRVGLRTACVGECG